jgi:hypothetical protein
VIGAKFEWLLEISGYPEFASHPACAAGAIAEQCPYFSRKSVNVPPFY